MFTSNHKNIMHSDVRKDGSGDKDLSTLATTALADIILMQGYYIYTFRHSWLSWLFTIEHSLIDRSVDAH